MPGKKEKGRVLQYHVMDLPSQGVDWEGTVSMEELEIEDDDGRFEYPEELSFRTSGRENPRDVRPLHGIFRSEIGDGRRLSSI